jgi:hypothetical protein
MNDQEKTKQANIQADMLADLQVTVDQADEVKGGPTVSGGSTGTFRLTFNGQTTA